MLVPQQLHVGKRPNESKEKQTIHDEKKIVYPSFQEKIIDPKEAFSFMHLNQINPHCLRYIKIRWRMLWWVFKPNVFNDVLPNIPMLYTEKLLSFIFLCCFFFVWVGLGSSDRKRNHETYWRYLVLLNIKCLRNLVMMLGRSFIHSFTGYSRHESGRADFDYCYNV